MKTYYLIKSYVSRYIGGCYEERFTYFGKANKVLGYIYDSDVKRYTKDDIRNHGYLSYRRALEAGWELREMEREPGWSIVINIIAETV